MKFRIKLLKDWTDPEGKAWKAGQVIEINDQAVAAKCVFEGYGEKVTEKSVDAVNQIDIEKTVSDAVEKAMSDDKLTKNIADKIHSISVKDKSDDDPFHGYLPESHRKERSREEKLFALGCFGADVYAAGENLSRPSERLSKSIERSSNMQKKAMEMGLIGKAAGTGLQVGNDADVGALIPPELNLTLLQTAAESAVIRPLCSNISLGTNSINLPKVYDYDRSSSLVHGGLLGYWVAEDAELTESKPKIENVHCELHALAVLAYASHQAMRFSPVSIGSFLLPKMGDAINFKEEDAFINGGGAGMPLGILNAGCKISITAESGQTSTAQIIVIKNIDKMEAQLKVGRAASVRWMYNRPDLFVWLRNLARTVGTGGEIAKIFQFTGFGTGTTSNIDGIPAVDLEHMPAAATNGDLTLVDWSDYLIIDDRSGAEIAQSMHLKFDYGQEAFRIIKYVGGTPLSSSAYNRHEGTNTISSILTIATRS